MPKAQRKKYYAVRVGRRGPKIYDTWEESAVPMFLDGREPYLRASLAEQMQSNGYPCHTGLNVSLGGYATLVYAHDLRPTRLPGGSSNSSILPHPLAPQILNHPSESYSEQVVPDSLTEHVPEHNPEAHSPTIMLSEEQKSVLEMVKRKENVFFTGSAGTGKSVLLRAIIDACGGRGSHLAITASTGIASVNIGGTTLHSWAGIGIGQEDVKKLVGKFRGQQKLRHVLHRWQTVKTLILDEISMIDGALFDKLESIAKELRGNDKPFGGIQLVLSGDFCQLPPVPDKDKNGNPKPPNFAFEANSWDRCIKCPVVLTKVFRQKEQNFVEMLNDMRLGKVDDRTIATFRSLCRPLQYEDGIGPTQLYPTRAEVDSANESRLRALSGNPIQYNSVDSPGYSNGARVSEQQAIKLLSRLVAPQTIQLKVGAQVMLIKNMIQGELVNGSVGQVIGFSTPREAKQTRTDLGIEEVLRCSERDLRQVLAKYEDMLRRCEESRWPVVRFTNGKSLLCIPTDFTVDNAYGEMEARRRQVPLILAYALSVHKSQGQTLERVKVDLSRTFENGQAYVALSRATSMKTLEVLNFDPSKVMVHPRILAWHSDLERRTGGRGAIEFDDDEEAYWDQCDF